MSIECGCERGGDCTRVSVCTMESELDDQAEEFQHRIEKLQGDVISLQLMEKSLTQYCKDHKAHIKALQARLDAVLAELTVLVDWIGRGFSAADAATEITAIIEREKALQEQK
jgi:DNA-binding FrmR family transcriptional regulator